jgi:triacylglycerol lipase
VKKTAAKKTSTRPGRRKLQTQAVATVTQNPFAQFNPNTTRWDPNNALALASASQLAYSDAATVPAQLQAWGFDPARFTFLNKNDTQGFVTATDEMVLVSFRGTQSNDIWDWMTDARIVLRPYQPGMVHIGFYNALNDVWHEINAAINAGRDKGQSLWVTGHSLGAALAGLAVSRMIFEEQTPINGLYTFGHPRMGNFVFGNGYDTEFLAKTFRYVNDQDIVTRIPPRTLGYTHVGRLLFFDKDDRLQNDDHFWNRFLTEVKVGIEGMKKPAGVVEDHAIQRYIDNLQKYLDDLAAGKQDPLTW